MAVAKKKTAAARPVADGDKKKALETALAQIEKDFGKGTIMKLGENTHMQVDSIPTGSLTLDLALGIGGIPRGRILVFLRKEHTLREKKMRMYLTLIRQGHSRYMNSLQII